MNDATDLIRREAQELRSRLIAACPPLEKRLRPGLPPEEARALADRHGVVLTEEALAFFSVLDGVDNPCAMPQAEVEILHGRWLESLEAALKDYERFWDIDHFAEDEPDFLHDDSRLVPPLRFWGEDFSYFYALDLRAEGRPVWNMQREMGLSPAFSGLEVMLQTVNTCLREGILSFHDGEWQGGLEVIRFSQRGRT